MLGGVFIGRLVGWVCLETAWPKRLSQVHWRFFAVVGGVLAILAYARIHAALSGEEKESFERRAILPIDSGQPAYVVVGADGRAIYLAATEPGADPERLPTGADAHSPAWSPDGSSIAYIESGSGTGELYTFDVQTGRPTRRTDTALIDEAGPAWSPDSRRIAFSRTAEGGTSDIWTLDVETGTFSRLTSHPANELEPTWSPDGDEIAFTSDQTRRLSIHRMSASGGRVAKLTHAPHRAAEDRQPAWSPHGRTIAFVRTAPSGESDILLIQADGRGVLTNITSGSSDRSVDPTWTPDGTTLYFTRAESEADGVYRVVFRSRGQLDDAGTVEKAPFGDVTSGDVTVRPVEDQALAEDWRSRPVEEVYAPLVRLHPDERYWPMSAERFIEDSELAWLGCDRKVVARRGEVDVARLGGPDEPSGYKITRGTCAGERSAFATSDLTRPREGGRAGLKGDEGFALIPDDDAPSGPEPAPGEAPGPTVRVFVPESVPTYFEHVKQRSITYWFYYGFSATQPAGKKGEHQGDWERITVCLDSAGKPTDVDFHKHNSNLRRRWVKVSKFGTHPIVYSAEGSHASYASPGHNPAIETLDRRFEGPVWATWKNLVDVTRTGWYGYGGSWGEPPGPLGPSPFKVGDQAC